MQAASAEPWLQRSCCPHKGASMLSRPVRLVAMMFACSIPLLGGVAFAQTDTRMPSDPPVRPEQEAPAATPDPLVPVAPDTVVPEPAPKPLPPPPGVIVE